MSRTLLAGLIVFCLALYSAAPLEAKGGKGGGGKGRGGGSRAKTTRTHRPTRTHTTRDRHTRDRDTRTRDRHTHPRDRDTRTRDRRTHDTQDTQDTHDSYPGSHGRGHDRHAGEPHTPGSHRPDHVKNRFEQDGEYRHDNGLLHGRQHALEVQRRNEERKLERRLARANELQELAAETDDEEMAAMAQRLEDKAMEHYDKRMAKIDEFRDRFGLTEEDPLGDGNLADGAADALTDAIAPDLASPTDAIADQVLAEQRVLDDQLRRAEQLRTLGETTGSQSLLDAADRVEEMALDRFDRSLDGFDELAPEVLEPLEPIPTSVPYYPRNPLRRLFGF